MSKSSGGTQPCTTTVSSTGQSPISQPRRTGTKTDPQARHDAIRYCGAVPAHESGSYWVCDCRRARSSLTELGPCENCGEFFEDGDVHPRAM